jgi:hypothetical protein
MPGYESFAAPNAWAVLDHDGDGSLIWAEACSVIVSRMWCMDETAAYLTPNDGIWWIDSDMNGELSRQEFEWALRNEEDKLRSAAIWQILSSASGATLQQVLAQMAKVESLEMVALVLGHYPESTQLYSFDAVANAT